MKPQPTSRCRTWHGGGGNNNNNNSICVIQRKGMTGQLVLVFAWRMLILIFLILILPLPLSLCLCLCLCCFLHICTWRVMTVAVWILATAAVQYTLPCVVSSEVRGLRCECDVRCAKSQVESWSWSMKLLFAFCGCHSLSNWNWNCEAPCCLFLLRIYILLFKTNSKQPTSQRYNQHKQIIYHIPHTTCC